MIEIGSSIGRYHIIEKLGEGGMATVYKAYDTRLEREVAIKVIRTGAFPPDVLERMLKRFEREGKSLARLNHLNIVSIIDYGEQDGTPYLVMPYYSAGTLKQRLGKPVPPGEAVRLLIPVARALAYAHDAKILHRDVKPSNILITSSGEPVLTDFGIAKLLEDDGGATLTGTGVGVGTPEYMAPEQGMGREIDGRADVYALGVVLYELVTGRKPYTADTPMAVIFKHLTDPLPRPKLVVPELPERIEQIIFKALAKKPEDRYASMAEFAKAMSEWREGLPRSGGDVSAATGTETPVELDETGEATVDLGTGTPAAAQAVETEGIATIDSGSSLPEAPPPFNPDKEARQLMGTNLYKDIRMYSESIPQVTIVGVAGWIKALVAEKPQYTDEHARAITQAWMKELGVGVIPDRITCTCGSDYPHTEIYCQKCGKQLLVDRTCPNCKGKTPVNSMRCRQCGKEMDGLV